MRGEADGSLINILILAINEQFTTSHTGELTALNESMAPELAAAAFKRARINKATDRKLLGVAFKTRGAQGEASADAKRRGPKPKPGQEGYKTKKQRREERQKDQTFQQKLIDAHGSKSDPMRNQLRPDADSNRESSPRPTP